MASAKTNKIIFWVSTILMVITVCLPAVFFVFSPQVPLDSLRPLGFPDYFIWELEIAKIIGGIVLLVPAIPARYKEWAYVGFGIDFVSAAIAIWVIQGPAMASIMIPFFIALVVSYKYFHKLNTVKM